MSEPQAILDPLSTSALFLVATIDRDGEVPARDLLGDIGALVKSVGFRVPEAKLSCVVGIGSDAWTRLFDGPRPRGLHPFVPLNGGQHEAPSTPGDFLFHIKATTMDACFELARVVVSAGGGALRIVDQTVGFRYFEQRDLLGFVDGSENPVGLAAGTAAVVGDEDPAFAGGSYAIVQKYLHDISAWEKLTTEEQEHAIGRTKLSNIELADSEKPANAHVEMAKVTKADGSELKIIRANMPFGSIKDGELGTYFIGYAASPSVTEEMLHRMFIGTDDATHDRILDFSVATTGSLFFVPSIEFLDSPPEAPPGR